MTMEKYTAEERKVLQMLQEALACKVQHERHQEELAKLRADAERVTTRYSSQPGGGGDGQAMANAVQRIVDLQQDIMAEDIELQVKVKEARALISKLPKKRDRQILRMKYLEGETYGTMSAVMHYSEWWINILHERAIKRLAAIANT